MALCGVFPPRRNIVKHWDVNEDLFLQLVRHDGALGLDHFMQSLVLYFIRIYKDQLSRFGPTFLKKLLDKNVISEKFLQDWFDKTIRLDKDSYLYDKKAEKKFRDLITDFITWMQVAHTEEGDEAAINSKAGADENDEEDDDQIKEQSSRPKETDAQRKQREAIEKQARQQQEMLENMKKNIELDEKAKMDEAESRIDATKIDANEDVDIDDIWLQS